MHVDGATGDVLASYVYGRYVDEVLSMRRDVDGDTVAEDWRRRAFLW